ncbi:unnamed protein product, partial [Ectocarpus sp. 13 AM-2016]
TTTDNDNIDDDEIIITTTAITVTTTTTFNLKNEIQREKILKKARKYKGCAKDEPTCVGIFRRHPAESFIPLASLDGLDGVSLLSSRVVTAAASFLKPSRAEPSHPRRGATTIVMDLIKR